MITIKVNGSVVLLFTDYDDKALCASIPGGRWDRKEKCWSYPLEALIDIKEKFGGRKFKADDKTIRALAEIEKRSTVLNTIKAGAIQFPKHPFLMEHQKKCREIARYYDRFAYFLDVGTGKTITSLQIVKDKACKFLVVCPKSIIKSAWVEDQEKFFPDMQMLPISRNMNKEDYINLLEKWGIPYYGKASADRHKGRLAVEAQVYVVNPESFKADIKEIREYGVQGLIIDESTIIKNPTSAITQALTAFADTMDYVYILSGKPAPNGQLDYFSQMRIIDKSLLGSSFFQFRARFFHPTGYGGYTWVMNSGAEEAIADRIARRAIFIRKEDCLDLPDVTDIKRMIDLPDDILKQYKVMEKQQLALLQDELIAVPNKMAAIMKLRQITSGFVLSNDEVVRFDSTKLHELMGVLEEIGDKQVIIWAQFKEEIRKIASAIADTGASVVTAYSETKDTDESIRMFKHGEAQYMVAHPATLKYGVTFTNCTYAVYYSMDYSFENYYQSAARIHRKGQTKPCTFIFLLAENTIDEIMYKVVNEKGDTAKVIEELARSAGRHK